MLEAVHAAWPPDEPAGMQVPLPAGGALQQQMIPPGPNAAAVAVNTGSHTAQLPCYQDGGASSPRRTHSGSMPCMPNQSQSAHVSMSAGVSAPAADGHAHPAIHPHHFVQSQAAPRHGPEGARPDHQFSGPSMHQHGKNATHTDGPISRERGLILAYRSGFRTSAITSSMQGSPFYHP